MSSESNTNGSLSSLGEGTDAATSLTASDEGVDKTGDGVDKTGDGVDATSGGCDAGDGAFVDAGVVTGGVDGDGDVGGEQLVWPSIADVPLVQAAQVPATTRDASPLVRLAPLV